MGCRNLRLALVVLLVVGGAVLFAPDAGAYERYKVPGTDAGNCATCHGDFNGPMSPLGTVFPSGDKHTMHRSSQNMNADCNLCHTSSDNRNPFIGSSDGTGDSPGVGCVGCHGRPYVGLGDSGVGLRLHHTNAGAQPDANGLRCVNCHPSDPPPQAESVSPTYYGGPDTNANEPCNPVAAEGINENWSVGDVRGLDNDGDLAYDGADSDCGGVCGDGTVDPGEDCDGGVCCAADCTYDLPDTACGDPSVTECDNADTCDGAGTCEPNYAAGGSACGDQGVECLADDACDGAGSCTDNGFEPADTACGNPSDTSCDNPDTCDGAGTCELNYELANTPCPDGEFCNGDELCDGAGVCDPGVEPCDPATEICNEVDDVCEPRDLCGDGTVDPGEDCDGGVCCAADCTYDLPDTACGDPSVTECDNADTCDGAGTCEPNYAAGGSACGDQGVECLADDACDGAGACTDNGFEPADTACGNPSDTSCDNPDTCDGAGTCELNYELANTPCPDGEFCNGDELCDGAGVCDPGVEPCDPATEICNEVDDVCEPRDLCGDGTVDPGEDCDGGVCCAADCTYDLPDTACGDPSVTECDNADTCDGAGTCEPNYAAGGSACGDQGVECLADDACDGAGSCTDNGFELDGTACGDPSTGQCDNADACLSGVCDANWVAGGTACDDDLFCNENEVCDGGGACDGGNPLDCSDGLYCNGVEVCNEATDACDPGTVVDCSDGVSCTDDSCDEATDSCDNTPNDGLCPDDGLYCTGSEFCDPVNDCSSTGDPCGPGETCDDEVDMCVVPPAEVDLDIAAFRATKRVTLTAKGKKGPKPVQFKLVVKNAGAVDEPRRATITGMLPGSGMVTVTVFDMLVSEEPGDGRTTYTATYQPDLPGEILWTAEIFDDDPDDDTATATTTVLP